MFDTNPPNWLMPSFIQRADINMAKRNKQEIVGILREFRNIINEDGENKEGKYEITGRGIERG